MDSSNRILLAELCFEMTRSGGPGGQHVNKTSSAVILRWNLHQTRAFDENKKNRLITKLSMRLTSDGELIIRSSEFRNQLANKKRCLDKLDLILKQALHIDKPRKKTKPTKSSKKKRLENKARHSQNKQLRQKIHLD